VDKVRKMILQLVICIGMLCMIWGGYALGVKKMNQQIDEVREDDFSWVAQVDEVKLEDGKFVLDGFAFQLTKNAQAKTFDIVLYDLDTKEYIFPKMEYTDRSDVNDYFLCQYDYTASGFSASIKEKEIKLIEHDYEILIKPQWESYVYKIGTFLSEGKLMFVNPKEFIPLDVAGTGLEEIVRDGALRVYEPENNIYVYQYEGDLYWIADEEYGFVDGDTTIQCQLSTTQVEKLPIYCLERGGDTDSIGFLFSNNEIVNANTGKYRVTKRNIPVEYSIVKIWTGNYIDGWKWLEYFRPRYEFELQEK